MLELDLNAVVPTAPPQAARRRRPKAEGVPAYLRSDFPDSQWLFQLDANDILKPADVILRELEAGHISKIARRPLRPRRRKPPASGVGPRCRAGDGEPSKADAILVLLARSEAIARERRPEPPRDCSAAVEGPAGGGEDAERFPEAGDCLPPPLLADEDNSLAGSSLFAGSQAERAATAVAEAIGRQFAAVRQRPASAAEDAFAATGDAESVVTAAATGDAGDLAASGAGDLAGLCAPTYAWAQRLAATGVATARVPRSPRLLRETPAQRRRVAHFRRLFDVSKGGLGSGGAQAEARVRGKILQVTRADEEAELALRNAEFLAAHGESVTAAETWTDDDETDDVFAPVEAPGIESLGPVEARRRLVAARPSAPPLPRDKTQRDAHRATVLARAEAHKALLDEAARTAATLAQAQAGAKARARLIHDAAARWLAAAAAAAAVEAFCKTRARRRTQLVEFLRRTMVLRIQRRVRPAVRAALRRRHAYSIYVIERCVSAYLRQRGACVKRRRRHEAADIVLGVLRPTSTTGTKLRRAILRFRYMVSRCQKVARAYVACRAARLEALNRMWLLVEHYLFHNPGATVLGGAKRPGGRAPGDGGECDKFGPCVAACFRATHAPSLPKKSSKDAFWRVPREARLRQTRDVFAALRRGHARDIGAFLADHGKLAGGLRLLNVHDARSFMDAETTINMADFIVLAHEQARPLFYAYTRAPVLIFAAICGAYDRRRERKNLLDPQYDLDLIRRIDSLLAADAPSPANDKHDGADDARPAERPRGAAPEPQARRRGDAPETTTARGRRPTPASRDRATTSERATSNERAASGIKVNFVPVAPRPPPQRNASTRWPASSS
ncbi:hypothetical protein M885DRAFT_528098 [Pelagophyceae sp. CCMP2097]|nr:hypothetical protein M885DRAFT_528098 [Pelagophyceae sp. CCMP2097]